MNKHDIINEVRSAFSNVALQDGIGLWEAQAIDDYETSRVQKEKRAQDEKVDWSRLSYAELQRCHSSLSFFNANGMKFHLPAFIIGSLEDEVDDPLFHLIQLDDEGLLTLILKQRRRPFFLATRHIERCVLAVLKRYVTPFRGKMVPSLWVAPQIGPCGVTRRSFGMTKLLSSCLAWPNLGQQRCFKISVNRP